jgi:Mg2+-importing ATPase
VGLASDRVDAEMVDRPRRFEMRSIARFMVVFGTISSLFDLLTFAVLLTVFQAGAVLFRTGWFVESILTELVIALVVRTQRPFWRSRPGNVLSAATAATIALACSLPYLPGARLLGFVPLAPPLMAAIVAIVLLYVLATELAKRSFFRGLEPATSR